MDTARLDDLIAAIGDGPTLVGVVTNSITELQDIVAAFPEQVEAVHLWDDYIASMEAQRGDAA